MIILGAATILRPQNWRSGRSISSRSLAMRRWLWRRAASSSVQPVHC